jgi:hypothetical protein
MMEKKEIVEAPTTVQEAIELNQLIENAEWFEGFVDAHDSTDCID